jgi:hypothetical protein
MPDQALIRAWGRRDVLPLDDVTPSRHDGAMTDEEVLDEAALTASNSSNG